jgi:Phosphotransferase enzyme family
VFAVTGRDGQEDLLMIDGLESALSDSGRPGLRELRGVLAELLDASRAVGRLAGEHCLKERKVYRLEFEVDGRRRSLIARCVDSTQAELNRRVATRWLPSVGLGRRCAALLGVASDPSAEWVWQVHEDLGDQTLETNPDRGLVEAAIDMCAELHVRFADHPLLPELRMYGKDMGMTYYLANIRDAIRGLEHLQPPTTDPDGGRPAVRDRLLGRLYQLLDEGPDRARIVAELGGPETMLHGDLFPKNVLTVATEDGLQAALIDWDRAGVGPLTYDLSTLLYRSPAEHRPWMLDRYQQSVAPSGWRVPSTGDLNLMLETAELSRIANYLAWVCIAAREPQADWLLESLEEIERWFEALKPAIRPAPATQAVAGP